ncbi:MAG: CoA transferase, partial [Hyphomicrobiaceae bacterium]|nr:CoA transferase [Hyphomicrobiaceae bacterium]
MTWPIGAHVLSNEKTGCTGPLAGLRVLELCQVAAGPFCGMLFADLGADVIKVETPAGDSMREWPPFNNGYSENFASLNRSKRSIALNLKAPEDRDILLALVRDCDILLENNRPGVMNRLGLSYETLSKANPALVLCSISAYGQSGPRSHEGGFDLTIQGV